MGTTSSTESRISGLPRQGQELFADRKSVLGPWARPPVCRSLCLCKSLPGPPCSQYTETLARCQGAKLGRATRAPWLWELKSMETELGTFPEQSQSYAALRNETSPLPIRGEMRRVTRDDILISSFDSLTFMVRRQETVWRSLPVFAAPHQTTQHLPSVHLGHFVEPDEFANVLAHQ